MLTFPSPIYLSAGRQILAQLKRAILKPQNGRRIMAMECPATDNVVIAETQSTSRKKSKFFFTESRKF